MTLQQIKIPGRAKNGVCKKPETNGNGTRRAAVRWHRRLGYLTAVFVLLLSVTGVLLNHARTFRLDQTTINASWVMALYNQTPSEPPLGVKLGQSWVASLAGKLYLPTGESLDLRAPLRGVVATDALLVVATAERIHLFTRDGLFIETLNGGTPRPILQLGLTGEGAVALRSKAGVIIADADYVTWAPAAETSVKWAIVEPLPETAAQSVMARDQSAGVSLERVIIDLHSGRFIGAWGPYLMDGIAGLFIILAVTGLVTNLRRKRS